MHRHHRFRRLGSLLALVGLLVTLGAPPAASAAVSSITLDLKASGLQPLTQVTSARDGSGRLFLVERRGVIKVFKDGAVLPDPFLDMRSKVHQGGGERGLLGLAFHRSFATNAQLFVFYTGLDGDVFVARYRANAARTAVMTSSFTPLLRIEHSSAANHNGGGMAFNPKDGYLYIPVGDGGTQGDPENDAQNITRNNLGKILRISVNGTGAGPYGNYRVPAGNPFVDRTGRDEIWAYGFRNPWRLSFDRATGDLWVADVGYSSWEEVNRQRYGTAGGKNYGWHVMEGRHCLNATCNKTGKTLPITEYGHTDGNCSITGGFVYRGPTQTALVGQYVFADFCSGRIWAIDQAGGNGSQVLGADTDERITSFGESDNGELYAVTIDGKLFQVLGS
jgi:glucose/arabinose dehydrogenase